MEILKTVADGQATVKLVGRLDTVTAPDLEKELAELIPTISALTLDFEGLDYLSSAGLRVLLNAQKSIGKTGKMIICHVNDVIMDVFDMTGFSSILTIED